jgi:hypothetical protein
MQYSKIIIIAGIVITIAGLILRFKPELITWGKRSAAPYTRQQGGQKAEFTRSK